MNVNHHHHQPMPSTASSSLIDLHHNHGHHPHHNHQNNSHLYPSSPVPNPSVWNNNNNLSNRAFLVLKDLKAQMHETHLSYLNGDEGSFRCKLREKLESLLNEFLMLIPHSAKFLHKEFRECFDRTVSNSNFDDPKRIIDGFEAVEHYATNLLNYPWRHEYHCIFAFSGFFHRHVRCTLVGYENIMELLGYTYDSGQDIYELLELPVDPDKMILASFQCFVAIAELRIMAEIKSRCPEISWPDIHSIRSGYICNIENAVDLCSDWKRNRSKLIDLDLPDYSVKKFDNPGHDFLISSSTSSSNKIIATGNNCGGINPQQDCLIPPPPSYLESDLDNIDFIDCSKTNPAMIHHQAFSPPPEFSNDFRKSNGGGLAPNESPVRIQTVKNSNSSFSTLPPGSSETVNGKRTITVKNLDPVLLAEIQRFEAANGKTNNGSPSNQFDYKPKIAWPASSSSAATSSNGNFGKNLPEPRIIPIEIETRKSSKWSCQWCTYHNTEPGEICEMCHRSRTKGNESKPLVTGGRECNKCTLVNEKMEKICKACGTSLADSPTYI